MTKIIKDKNFLSIKTTPVSTIEEGQEIASKLIDTLKKLHPRPFGLSANQIGIQKSVCVIWVEPESEPITLINPRYIEKSDELVIYPEVCISIGNKVVKTKRHVSVKIETLNFANVLTFKPRQWPLEKNPKTPDIGMVESVCVQHVMDLLNGKLITDHGIRFIQKTKVSPRKIGPNDKVMISKGNETQFIKQKKAIKLISDGWKIV